MSFRGEMKDFIDGMKAGQDYWQKSADIDYRRAQWEKIRPATDADRAGQPGVPKGSGGAISDTPQASQGGGEGGGKVSIKRTGDDEAAARRDAIASIESGGNYRAVGSQTKSGDRAYGRYQIMGNNVPVWTKQVLGKAMTPGEFLADQQAQDQVFDVMFDGYVGQFGPAGAAQAWLGGPGSVGKTDRADMHGTTVGAYGQRFMAAYNQFGGSGAGSGDAGTAVASSETPAAPAKAKPAISEDDEPKAEPEKPEEPDRPASPEAEIKVVDAAPANVGTPQVQTTFFAAAQPQAGGLSDPRDQEVRPTLFAAEGGAIPEPDKYNAARAYTQPIAAAPKSDFTPRRVGQAPAVSAAAGPAAGSYQQKFRDMQAARAVAPVAAAPAAVQPSSYAQQLVDWQKKAYPWGQAGGVNFGSMSAAGNMPQLAPNASAQDRLFAQQASNQFRNDAANWQQRSNQLNAGGMRREQGGMVYSNFAEGGAIPDPAELYARGGAVKDTRSSAVRGRSYHSGSSRGDSAGYTTSSPGWRHDDPDADKPYFQPRRKPLPPSGIAKITKKGKPLGAAGPVPSGDRGPKTTSATEPELRKAAGTPTEGYEPKAKAAGTPFPPEPSTFPARPEVHSDNAGPAEAAGTPTLPYEPRPGPFPARPDHPGMNRPRPQPGSKGHSEPPPGSAVIDIDPRRFGRSGSGPPPAIDNGMSTIPGVRNAVPGTDVPRGGSWVDPNTGQPGTPPAIPDPTAMQGAWVNGQWVPINTTAAAGQGFARGGKVDKNVRSSAVKGRSYRPTFANSRADSAGYTTSSPGWRRDEEFPEAPRPASPRRSGGGRATPGGGGGVDPQTTGAIPTPYPRPILEDRETRWRGSDYPIQEDRETRFRPNDIERGQPPAPQGVVDLPSYGQPPAPQAVVEPPAIPDDGSYYLGATGIPAHFAAGGAVPDDEDQFGSPRAESAGFTTSAAGRPAASRATAPAASTPRPAPAAEEPQKADVEPTPHLLSAVSQAVQGGARFLTQHFGLGGRGDGAVPTPESGAQREDGIRRFASGEGAMTPQEIQGIDDAVDPNRELSEGDRQMNRFAQTMNWYLERGRKDDAEAAAAGLMQYGAQRFGKLGSMSGAAYKKYLETKDPKDLEAATQFLSKAYEMIPDGAGMAITIDPDTHMLQATRVGADGKEEAYDISPGEIPGLIQQTMNQSGYWKQIFSLSDPTGAHQEDAQAEARRTADVSYGRDEKKELRKHDWDVEKEDREAELAQKKLEESRAYTEGEETRQHERDRGEKLTDEKSAEERTRRQTLLSEALTRTRPDKTGKAAVDPTAVAGMLETADSIKAEIGALELGDNDKPPPELQDKLDEALSRLYDASGQDEDLMTKLGYGKETWRYRGAPPVAGAKKSKDGNWYKPDPARPGKWIKLTPQEAPAETPVAATG